MNLIVKSLAEALSLDPSISQLKTPSTIIIESNHVNVELDLSDISCIEVMGRQLLVTDLLGKVQTYRIKPNVFSTICKQLDKDTENHAIG